jgi:cupin fold WbuC family metalloprotein
MFDMADVQLINEALFAEITNLAVASPRRRMNHNFHSEVTDNPHRFLNILLQGTYVRPHRHTDPPKAESFLVLEGIADVIIFDDHGLVTSRYRLGDVGPSGFLWGVDLAPRIWHTILPRTERAVCFEVKPGPWVPATDKEFASWAPSEGSPAAEAYVQSLLNDGHSEEATS